MSDFMLGLIVIVSFCIAGIVALRIVSRFIASQIRHIQSGMQSVKQEQEEKSLESKTTKSPVQAVQASRKFVAAKVVDYSDYEQPAFVRKLCNTQKESTDEKLTQEFKILRMKELGLAV